MKNNDISRKLVHKLFLESIVVQINDIIIRTRGGGGAQKGVIFLPFSQEVFRYFPHIIVLFCVKLIRKFIHQCKMQQCKELFLIKEGFEYICMFSGVIVI